MDIGHRRARPTRKTAEMDRVGTGTHGHTRKGYTYKENTWKQKERAYNNTQGKEKQGQGSHILTKKKAKILNIFEHTIGLTLHRTPCCGSV